MAAGCREGFVTADGFRVRHIEAGGWRFFICAAQILSSEGAASSKRGRPTPSPMRRLSRRPEQMSLTDEQTRIAQAIDSEFHRLQMSRNDAFCPIADLAEAACSLSASGISPYGIAPVYLAPQGRPMSVMPVERKLTAILAADYSRLMARGEVGTHSLG